MSREVKRCPEPLVDAFDEHDDLSLMMAVAAGDDRARRRLATRLIHHTRRISAAILGRGPDADDAAQQALIEILEGAAGFRGDARLEAWARKITVRVALRMARAGQRRPIDPSASVDVATGEGEPLGLDAELPHPLQHYLEQLPAAQREAIVLRYTCGMSRPEIADKTGVSVPGVNYRLWVGLRRLRALIRRDQRLMQRTGER